MKQFILAIFLGILTFEQSQAIKIKWADQVDDLEKEEDLLKPDKEAMYNEEDMDVDENTLV